MGDVLQFRPLPKDGIKERIRKRREELALEAKAILDQIDGDSNESHIRTNPDIPIPGRL